MTAFERHQLAVRDRLRRSGTARPGHGSISWTINREIAVLGGWGRAILLQLAHPLIAAAIDDHTNFRGSLSSSVTRLVSTVRAMLAITFGSDEDAIRAGAGINVIHDRVYGTAEGERYSAHDPELLRWVHATLLDSIPKTYDLLAGTLTPDDRDRYCREAAVMEPLLDIPPGLLPRTAAELDAYMHEMLAGRLVVTDRSRALARAALFPPGWRLLWPALRPVQLITIGLLPPAIREAYGFTWTARDARALARWSGGIRITLRVLPAFAKHWPASRHAAGPHANLTTPSRAAQDFRG